MVGNGDLKAIPLLTLSDEKYKHYLLEIWSAANVDTSRFRFNCRMLVVLWTPCPKINKQINKWMNSKILRCACSLSQSLF